MGFETLDQMDDRLDITVEVKSLPEKRVQFAFIMQLDDVDTFFNTLRTKEGADEMYHQIVGGLKAKVDEVSS